MHSVETICPRISNHAFTRISLGHMTSVRSEVKKAKEREREGAKRLRTNATATETKR